MDMIGKIRRMYRRDKKTKREIARATGLSRNTVAKWLNEAQPIEPNPKYYRKAAKASKLSAYESELTQALKADAKRPKKDRRTGKALFAQIKASGYEGGYLPFSQAGGALLFHLLSKLYEHTSVMITTNLDFKE